MIRLVVLLPLLIFGACQQPELGTPKPRMYPKVDYPVRSKVQFDEAYCKLKFEYPNYFSVEQDQYFFDSKPIDPCWFDLVSKQLNSQLHCSYIPVNNRKHFDQLVNDAFKMTSKHNQKANYRREQLIKNPEENVHGILFEHDGPVASPLQFFVTDSTKHFFRASLYFKSQVNPDSIAPVYDFVKTDILEIIESFKWN